MKSFNRSTSRTFLRRTLCLLRSRPRSIRVRIPFWLKKMCPCCKDCVTAFIARASGPNRLPERHILSLLDEAAQKSLVRVAEGGALEEDEKDHLFNEFGEALTRPDFAEGPSFGNVPGLALLRLTRPRPAGGVELYKYNRAVLEMCYPEQIVPLHQRDKLDEPGRERWRRLAQADLEKARRE